MAVVVHRHLRAPLPADPGPCGRWRRCSVSWMGTRGVCGGVQLAVTPPPVTPPGQKLLWVQEKMKADMAALHERIMAQTSAGSERAMAVRWVGGYPCCANVLCANLLCADNVLQTDINEAVG